MPLILQKARANDCVFIRDCAELAYVLYVDRIGRKPAPMVADFKSEIAQGTVDLLISDGETVGYAVTFPRDDHLFVENVAILPPHQGKGLARQLFVELEARAKEAGLMALELYTNEKMTENIGLYGHLGFDETERRSEEGFNRVFFRKNLA